MHQHLVDDHLEEQRRDQGEQLQEERRDQHFAQEAAIFVDRAQEPGDVEAAGDVRQAGPARHQDQPAVPDRGEARPASSGRAGRLRRLHQDLVLGEPWPAPRSRHRAGTRWRARASVASRDQSVRQARAFRPRSLAHRIISGAPILSVPRRCLICPRSAATPFRCSSSSEGLESRIGWSRGAGGGAWCVTPGLEAWRSGVRLREQRRLVRVRVGNRRAGLALACRGEGSRP